MRFNTAVCVCVAGGILLNIAGSLCQSNDCGKAKLNTKIIGGQNTTVGSWPWQVSVEKTNEGHLCGGSLISKTWVLSAAHCFTSVSADTIVVYFGRQTKTGPNPNEKSSRVIQVINHPNYNSISEDNDITLLQLSSPVEFSEYIQPVCLAAAGSTFGSGTKSWITGWGKVNVNSNQFSNILQEVQVPIVGDTACKNIYGKELTDNMICAGLNQGGKDACLGDSGGPLVSRKGNRWIQSGIVSFGQGCAQPEFPGVYAKVSKYQDWITSKITSDQPGFVQFISADETVGFTNSSFNSFEFTLSLTYSIIQFIFSLYLLS